MKAVRGQTGIVGPSAEDEGVTLVVGTNRADLIDLGETEGRQFVIAGNGDDTIFAGGAPDTVEGGNGGDMIDGGGGPDRLLGGNGADVLLGGGGPDVIIGGNGKDTLVGGPGPDTLTGGNGADVFVLSTDEGHDDGHASSLLALAGGGPGGGGHGIDTITDFTPGLDTIAIETDRPLDFADGPAAFSIWLEQDGADTILRADLDGIVDGGEPAEIAVRLVGVEAVSVGADDILFL